MKRILSFGAAIAMLFGAASCQQENLPEGANGEAVVSLAVALPNPATKVIGDGTNVDILYYEVWSDNNGQLGNKLTYGSVERTTAKVFDLDLTLLSDQTYHFLFWAQVNGKDYYTVTDLTNVTVNYDNARGNDESRAAFYAHKSFLVEGALNETIMLKRPFAQLNFGTSTLKSDLQKDDVTVNASKITVKGPATAFNVATGLGSDKATEDVVFTADKAFDLNPEILSVSGTDYHYLSMNYFLVPEGESVTLGVDADFTTSFGTVKHQFVNVPVAQNYRTNIIGDLLFNKADFQIVVDERFEDQADEWEGGKYGVLDGKRYVKVETIDEFNAAFANENIDMIILLNDLVLTESVETKAASDYTLTISAGKELILDLNGKKLSATSSQTGKNYNMFDVRGTLTVKNGTIEYQHTGSDMGWNNFAEIFYVGFNGTLNLEGVNAENKGGSAMAYVVDMVNATNITVNVDNSTLKSTYIPVRVFNNSDGVNNVTIKNSELDGMYCFWVQYYLSDGRNEETLEKTLKLDIFNSADGEGNNNTFTYTNTYGAPVLYGFNKAVYFDANGAAIVYDAEALADILTSDKENIAVSLGADIDLPITSLGQQTGGSGEYKLGGENTKAITIDLNGKKLNVTTTYWSALGAKNDNALVTIKNGTMTSSQATGTWNSYDLTFANCNYAVENVAFDKSIAFTNAGKEVTLNAVTINETHDYYAMWVSAKGQTFNIDGLTITSAGRGIKIDEQYVGTPEKVIMNINDATFTTAKKAAILVKSVAGAEINASELNITNVAEDDIFAVWVDEDAAEYADEVVVDGALVKVEGTATVETADNLIEALENGKDVVFVEDVNINPAGMSNAYGTTGINVKNGQTIDGGGHTLDIKGAGGTWDSGISTTGGLIKNITITGSFRGVFINHNSTHAEKVVLENVIIDGTTYTISCDQGTNNGLDATNCTFKGWTSYAATLGNAKFTDCYFGEGNGNSYCRPYAPTEFVGCEFEAGFTVDPRAAISFENCTLDGVAITAENVSDLVTDTTKVTIK